MTDTNNKLFLNIKSKTWTRDSHGLFDYESTTVKENNMVLIKACKLIRRKHEIKEKEVNDIIDKEEQMISNVYFKDNRN